MLLEEAITAIKQHRSYINARGKAGGGERRRERKDTRGVQRRSAEAPVSHPTGRGSAAGDPGGAYVRERVKWNRWRSPLKVRKECGGKLRVVIWQ